MALEQGRDISQQFARIYDEVRKRIIGYDDITQKILIAIFCSGHVLLESVPGMGKTMLAKTISETLDCDFKRVQGIPDLTAKDIIGEMVRDPATNELKLQKGPIFTNILLVDEINRAPPKTQAALLEVMAEKTATIGGVSYKLSEPFTVIATENPLEQEGVFPLPEAEKDRFLFKIVIKYLSRENEMSVVKSRLSEQAINKIFNPAEILIIREEIKKSVTIKDSILDYAVRIVEETRKRREVQTGASPRASIALMETAKAMAFLEGREYVTSADIRKLSYPVLRHRIILSPEYRDMGTKEDDVIRKILNTIDAPM